MHVEAATRGWRTGLVLAALIVSGHQAAAQVVDVECDTNNDGVVDDLPDHYNDEQQYANLLNFYSITMAYSPLHAPAPLQAYKLNASLELSYIPQLNCVERSAFSGYKTEHTNKSPVLPRLHLTFGLPGGFYVGVSGVPPVKVAGVQTSLLGGELGYGKQLHQLQVGGRAYLLGAKVKGDLAGPFSGLEEDAVDDVFRARVWGIDAMVGYRIDAQKVALIPYLGLGYTHVKARMYVGENFADGFDDTDPSQATVPSDFYTIEDKFYNGPNAELGLQAKLGGLDFDLEFFMVPTNLMDPPTDTTTGNPRFFFSPRLRVGYDFF